MEAMKQIFGTFGAVVGVLSGLITLYAKYCDIKKKAGREDDAPEPPTVPVRAARRSQPDEFGEPAAVLRPWPSDSAGNARQLVRGPAIALMVAGGLSLVFNLAVAGFGYVDEFVTPLSTETKLRHDAEAARMADPRATYVGVTPDLDSGRTSAMMGAVALVGFAFASAAALWAGYNMLRLRSYWLSMAGSIAIMPGAFMCCMAGFPIGIWSLMVLLKPEVSSAFR